MTHFKATPSGMTDGLLEEARSIIQDAIQAGVGSPGYVARIAVENLTRPETTIQGMLKRNGVRMRPRGRIEGSQVTVTHEEIVRAGFLYERMGMSTHEVAQAMGLSYTPTRNRLLLAGVQFRTKKQAQRAKAERRKAMA